MATATQAKALSLPKVVLLASLLLAVVLFALSRRGVSRPIKVTIPQGATLASTAEVLKRAGIIRSSILFRVTSEIVGQSGTAIVPGRYIMPSGASYGRLLDQLRTGSGRYRRLTIPEGWSILEIAALMRDSLSIPVDSLIAATRDSSRRARMQTPARDVEGYLFPATYDFSDGISARNVIDTMLVTFDKRWKSSWNAVLSRDGRSRHAVVTLASIVEKEAGRADERQKIASVYMNRLRAGMRLQADPTVLYAMGSGPRRVLYADLKFESPYNTYRVAGLPPGPIASPGTASLAATIAPAETDAMFFVAFPDGHSEFTATFKQHSAAVSAARSARDSGSTKK